MSDQNLHIRITADDAGAIAAVNAFKQQIETLKKSLRDMAQTNGAKGSNSFAQQFSKDQSEAISALNKRFSFESRMRKQQEREEAEANKARIAGEQLFSTEALKNLRQRMGFTQQWLNQEKTALRQLETERTRAARAEEMAARQAQRVREQNHRQEMRHIEAEARERAREQARHGAARYITQGVAGAVSAHGIARVVESGAEKASEYQTEELRQKAAGITPKEIQEGQKVSRQLSGKYRAISEKTINHDLRNLRSVVGSMDEATHLIEDFEKLRTMYHGAHPEKSEKEIDHGLEQLMKAAELGGYTQNPEKLRSFLDSNAKVLNQYGDTVRMDDMANLYKRGKASTKAFGQKFMTTDAPILVQEMGGDSAGTALETMYQKILGGHMSGGALAALNKIGMLDQTKIKGFNNKGQPTGLKAGGVLGTKQFLDNPFEFAQMLDRQMEKHGIRGEQQKKEFIATIAPDRNTENMLTTFITQRDLFLRNRKNTQNAEGLSSADRYLDESTFLAWEGVKTQFDNFLKELTGPLLPLAAKGLNLVSGALSGLTNLASEFPKLASGLAVLVAGGAFAAAGLLSLKLALGIAGLTRALTGLSAVTGGGLLTGIMGRLGLGGLATAIGSGAAAIAPMLTGAIVLGIAGYLGSHSGQIATWMGADKIGPWVKDTFKSLWDGVVKFFTDETTRKDIAGKIGDAFKAALKAVIDEIIPAWAKRNPDPKASEFLRKPEGGTGAAPGEGTIMDPRFSPTGYDGVGGLGNLIHRAAFEAEDGRKRISDSVARELVDLIKKGNTEAPFRFGGVGSGGGQIQTAAFGGLGNGTGANGASGDAASGTGGGGLAGQIGSALRNRFGGGGGGSGGGYTAGEGSGGSTDPKLSGDVAARAKVAHDFFRSKGLSEEATAGILASMKKESNFTPNARGDGGRAHGLFQHHADRRAAIMRATGINMSTASFEKQLEGAFWEMEHGDAGAQRALKALRTPGISARDAGAAFVKNFERPARDERAERGALAEGFYRRFSGQGGGNAAGVATGGNPSQEKAVDNAAGLVGMGSSAAARALGSKMTPGNWCADFVNGALKSANVQGVKSSIATSFLHWGESVSKDAIRKGDVLVEARGRRAGQTGGHAGIATGNVRRDRNGNVTEIEMLSGNHSKKVGRSWERADKLQARRAVVPKQAPIDPSQARPPAPAGGAGGVNHKHHGDVHIHVAGHNDNPEQVAHKVHSRMRDQFAYRGHDVDYDSA